MTTPTGLELVWANAGGTDDPGEAKYQLGWIAEIPTFQNFNHVLKALDEAKLAYAEKDIHAWQDRIAYEAGARVERGEKTFYCITDHNDIDGTNPQDPLLDTTNSYWVNGVAFSSVVDAFTNLKAQDGVRIDQVNPKSDKSKWEGNDLTINSLNNLIALNSSDTSNDNLLFGNVNGKIVVINVGDSVVPDGRSISAGTGTSYELYHEGHRPTQAEVSGTIPDSPANGKLYSRRNGSWVEVTSTTVSTAPPPAVRGNGQGWYNLEDGQYYIDINDGDSSQWVMANPPLLPQLLAGNIEYTDTHNLGSVNVQGAIDEVASRPLESRPNLLINGGMTIWQRANTQQTAGYGSVDRFQLVIGSNATASITRNTDGHLLSDGTRVRTALGLSVAGATEGATGSDTCIRQVVEGGAWTASGKPTSVSAWIYTLNDAGKQITLAFGDEYVKRTLQNGWNQYSATFAARDRFEDTASPNAWCDIGVIGSANVLITNVKAEISSEPTPFIEDSEADNLNKCFRYYYQSQPTGYVLYFPPINTSGARQLHLQFPTRMARIPNISVVWTSVVGSLSYLSNDAFTATLVRPWGDPEAGINSTWSANAEIS